MLRRTDKTISCGLNACLKLISSSLTSGNSQKMKRKMTNKVSTIVMGYETSKLFTSDTNLERGNAQRERWKIATTC